MANTSSVAISYEKALGWIDFDAASHKATVNLDNAEGKKLVEDYLSTTHKINVPHKTLMDFTEEIVNPLADIESFQTAITRLWNETQVLLIGAVPLIM